VSPEEDKEEQTGSKPPPTLAELLAQFGTFLAIPLKLLDRAGYVRRERNQKHKEGYSISPKDLVPGSDSDEIKTPNVWGKYRPRKKNTTS
jgi:hypothetical protein